MRAAERGGGEKYASVIKMEGRGGGMQSASYEEETCQGWEGKGGKHHAQFDSSM